ncbi:hypothetical protein YC2023_089599 [Brassica napus]
MCMMGKQNRERIPKKSSWRASRGFELVHTDIYGPISPTSESGKKYTFHILSPNPVSPLGDAIPGEKWSKLNPTVKHLRAFGCIAYGMEIQQVYQDRGILMKNKFKMCYCEHNSFVKIKYEGVLVLRTYVDDIIYMGNSREMRDVFKRSMMKEFAMTDLGRMKYFIERLSKKGAHDAVDSTQFKQLVRTLSDYAEDVNDQKSTAGNVFMMGEGAVSWSSKNQPIVILSITEAKILAAAFGSCQIMWQQNIFEEIGVA